MLKKIEKSLVAVMLIAAVILNGSPLNLNATANAPEANASGAAAEAPAGSDEREAIEPVTVAASESQGKSNTDELTQQTEITEMEPVQPESDPVETEPVQAESDPVETEPAQTESETVQTELEETVSEEPIYEETESALEEESEQEMQTEESLSQENGMDMIPETASNSESFDETESPVTVTPQEVTETEDLPEGESREARYRITFINSNQGLSFMDLLGNYISAGDALAGEDYRFCVERSGSQLHAKVTVLDSYTDESGLVHTRELVSSNGIYTIPCVTEDHSIRVETKQVLNIQLPTEGISLVGVEAYLTDGTAVEITEMTGQESGQRQYLVDEGAYIRVTLQVGDQYQDKSPIVLQGETPLSAQSGTASRTYVYHTNTGITRETTLFVKEAQKNTYKISLPSVEGGLIQEVNGYNANAVVSGASYQFKLTLEEAYQKSMPVVTANGKALSGTNGIYTISDIREDQKVEITGIEKSYYKVELPVQEGLYLLSEQGYEAGRIAHGEDYKFRLQLKSGYGKSPVRVFVDGTALEADKNGVYTISNIKSDKKVTVEGIRKNLVIKVSAASVRVGAKITVKVENVPEGYKLDIHNCTPTRGILSKDGKLTGVKKGTVKLIATAVKGNDKLQAVKRVKIKKAAKKSLRTEDRMFQADGINYKVMKSAGKNSKGSVMVANNQNNRNLDSDVTIPSVVTRRGRSYRVTGIDANAFYGVSSIRSITIPKSVSNISSTAFVKCRNLTDFKVASGNNNYSSDGNRLLSKNGKTLIAYPSAEGEVAIGGKITTIAPYALSATRITKLTVGSGVKQISVCAFSHTSLLRKVYLKSKNAETIQCGCAFDHVNQSCLVYVPEESMESYEAAITEHHGTKTLRFRELQ